MKRYKRILYILIVPFLMVLAGCERVYESEGLSRITEYAAITLNGETEMFLKQGEAYNEEGATTETGDPVTISGEVDVNTPGVYTVTYSAVNVDGYAANETRTVYVSNVGDFQPSIEGFYVSNVARVSPAEDYEGLQYMLISKTGENTYTISDALGGFYSLGRAYGDLYNGSGVVITDNGGGNYSFQDGTVVGFDDTVSIKSLQIDPATKTITLSAVFSGYTFNST
ncbi:MAG TPA: BT_2262 family domain-containing protein, partial [Cytophagales bacterium]|nr:BT_2262 family domain-containing protein [Cytophagales bacterium]